MVRDEEIRSTVKQFLEAESARLIRDAFNQNRIGQLQQLPLSTNEKLAEVMIHTLDGFHYQEGYDSVLLTSGLYPVIVSQDFTDQRDFSIVVGFAEPLISDERYARYVIDRGEACRDLIVVTGFGDVIIADGYNIGFNNKNRSGIIDVKDPVCVADFFIDMQAQVILDRTDMKLSEPTHAKLNWRR